METAENGKSLTAERIKLIRRKNGMTQTELANKLNVSRSVVSGWESARRLPGGRAAYEISRLFGVSVDYIFGKSDHVYNINIPDYLEIDLNKLNSEGIKQLNIFYKLLVASDEYRLDKN